MAVSWDECEITFNIIQLLSFEYFGELILKYSSQEKNGIYIFVHFFTDWFEYYLCMI